MYLDYRGRIYNRDPYFSYQSNDLARAHFLFAEEKEIDQKGAEYTFIHIATSFNQTYTIDELKIQDWTELDYIKELEFNSLVDISVDKMGVIDKHNWTIENIEKICTNGIEVITVRPHPAEKQGKYDYILDHFGDLPIEINRDQKLLQQIAHHQWVVGCNTMPMVIGLMNGNKVLCSIPPYGRLCQLPYKEIEYISHFVSN